MASPNHRAGLAVVVPASDDQSQPRGTVKQNAFTSPRKMTSQPMKMNTPRQANGIFHTHQPLNVTFVEQQPKDIAPRYAQNGTLQSRKPANEVDTQSQSRINHRGSESVHHLVNGRGPNRPRLFGVEEALQYSPFSSIIPFSTDIIPIPNSDLPSSQLRLFTLSEQDLIKGPLACLNEELSHSFRKSELAFNIANDLKTYLDQDVITDFKFKDFRTAQSSQKRGVANEGGLSQLSSPTVSPFAAIMLQSTDLCHQYPTPTTSPTQTPQTSYSEVLEKPSSTASESKISSQLTKYQQTASPLIDHVQQIQQQSPVPPTTQVINHTGISFLHNGETPAKSTFIPITVRTQVTPMVVIPPKPAGADQNASEKYEELPLKDDTGTFEKRKRDAYAQQDVGMSQAKDQRAASDDLSSRVQEIIQEIFEAEDQFQYDDSACTASINSHHLVLINNDGQEMVALSPATHTKMETLLSKLINIGRFQDVPVEHLQRLQRLSEASVTSLESADLCIDASWDAERVDAWVHDLDAVIASLRSARTILRIMTGGREEKELYSEELLQILLRVVKRVLDRVIFPIIESRSSDQTSSVFQGAFAHKVISRLMFDVTKVMSLLARLLAKVDMAETVITTIEFFAMPLLFVGNSPSEKDPVLGTQKLATLRRTAMDQISAIFSRYQGQRMSLLDEILTSLQKLPVNEKHARHYKLAEGKNIMLVSALIMQLVQISATQSDAAKGNLRWREPDNSNDQKLELKTSSRDTSDSDEAGGSEGFKDINLAPEKTTAQILHNDATNLMDNATKIAQYVIKYLVQRASNTAKTSESPHRQHLDMFVQDLISVLPLPEWPGAELLLQMVFGFCRSIAENVKSTAFAKNMALELLGMIGLAISDLVSSLRQASRFLDSHNSEVTRYLRQMVDDFSSNSLACEELAMWSGPYHAVVEYLGRNDSDESQDNNAQGYLLIQWAKAAACGNIEADPKGRNMCLRLSKALSGVTWVTSSAMPDITDNHVRIAYALILLRIGFCRHSEYILKILLDAINSEQIIVRTRSLKSVDKMLEGDPSVLDRNKNVKSLITSRVNDKSPMVRESALTLIGKCIVLRPLLESEFLSLILKLTDDLAVGMRKRSIRMLKDVYLRHADQKVKTAIGENLLQRITDLDTGVADLTRQVFEEIWLSPFWNVTDLIDTSAQIKMDIRTQIRLVVGIVRRGDKEAEALIRLLKALLSNNSKNASANFKVCKNLVASAFDTMIDDFQDAERPEQRHILQTLTFFARANAKLFTHHQLQSLQPYIANLAGKDDLDVFRSIVIIFRCVLPMQSSVQHKFLQDIQNPLLQSVNKVGKVELNEVADCLWTINGTLQNMEKLTRLMMSVIQKLHQMRDKNLSQADHTDNLKRVKKYIQIAGCFGRHCDYESQLHALQASFPSKKFRTAAELIVESIRPFTATFQPLPLRSEALDSIGLICQSSPYQFTQEHISNSFQEVLRYGEAELQSKVLSSFRDFFASVDHQAEVKSEKALGIVDNSSEEKLGGSMTANDDDGASALIAQRFLKDILSIALASQDSSALTATEVIASINRQGLVHPKESGPALVALGTSSNLAIADVAVQEHRRLHQQHESMFEREYMRAIQEAFKYQRDVIGDTLGYRTRPYTSKLHAMFEIIKTSKGKYQKKFLENFCSKIDFDISKMDLSGTPPAVLQMSRFLIENLAFLDYGRLDELLHTIACMEKVVASTGSDIAHSINTEVFNITIESMPENAAPAASQDQNLARAPQLTIEPLRLYQLTTAAIILCLLWETRTYLRRLYSQSTSQQKREGKNKTAAKDLNKAPSRAQGVTGEKLLASIAEKVRSLDSENSMKQQCRDFVELLSVDSEVKVAAEGEESPDRLETPSEDNEQDTPMSGRSQGVKRKNSVSVAGTPMKKKRGRPSIKRRKSGKSLESDEDWD
ncbi:Sister chromatid cohesion protein 2 [Lecanora helva]